MPRRRGRVKSLLKRAIASSDIWIAWGLLLALIARKTILLRRRAVDDYAAVDGSAALEIGLVGLACLFLITRPYAARVLKQLQRTSLMWLLVFYVLCAVSAAWSDRLTYSLFQAVEVISQTLLVFLLLSAARSFDEAEKWVLQIAALATVMDMLIQVKFHGLSLSLANWHTNSYTISSAMLFCYAATESIRATGARAKRLRRYAMFAGPVTVLGTSAASYLAGIGGMGVAALLVGGRRWPLVAIFVLAIVGAVASPDTATDLVFPDKTEEQMQTLHGRTYLWTMYSEQVMESPLIGHGFAMGAKLGGFKTTNTHNSLFSVLLATGFLGFAIVLVAAAKLGQEVLRSTRWKLRAAAGCGTALAAGLANSLSMAFLGEAWRPPSLVFTAFLCLLVFVMARRLEET